MFCALFQKYGQYNTIHCAVVGKICRRQRSLVVAVETGWGKSFVKIKMRRGPVERQMLCWIPNSSDSQPARLVIWSGGSR